MSGSAWFSVFRGSPRIAPPTIPGSCGFLVGKNSVHQFAVLGWQRYIGAEIEDFGSLVLVVRSIQTESLPTKVDDGLEMLPAAASRGYVSGSSGFSAGQKALCYGAAYKNR